MKRTYGQWSLRASGEPLAIKKMVGGGVMGGCEETRPAMARDMCWHYRPSVETQQTRHNAMCKCKGDYVKIT
jgi:hypothetical protein